MGNKANCLLQGIRILDMADDTVSLCSKLLSELGASVTRMESPPSRLNRDRSPVVFDRSKGSFALGEFLQEADILIESAGQERHESICSNREEIRFMHPRLIHLFISPFGLTGPKKHYRASATVLSAAGGEMFHCRDAANRPSVLYGAQPYFLASLSGAVAVLTLLLKRRITGKGGFIDLSIQEALASAMNYTPAEGSPGKSKAGEGQKNHPLDADFPTLPCSDGYIQLALTGDWTTLAEILASEGDGSELLLPPWTDPAYRRTHSALLSEILKAWTRKHSREELYELGQTMAFPWAPLYHPREVLESPQLRDRKFFVKAAAKAGAPESVYPGSPYKFFPEHVHPATATVADRGKGTRVSETVESGYPDPSDCPGGEILKGIRILDLTRMLSGPYCTRLLADFGAEVFKIQSGKTSTGAERNDTAYFAAWNRNKRGITLDLGTEEGREIFLELVSASDIVVENYSPRVMANWGLRYDRLREANPALVMLSMSAMGQTGPWKNYVGFAPTFHALSGLLAASSSAQEEEHIRIGYPHADIVAGLYGALSILAAVLMKARTGQGCRIDLSCYESMCTSLGRVSAGRPAAAPRDNIHPLEELDARAFPDACYPCKGEDCWCAFTIENETSWKELCRIVADPELVSEKFSSNAARILNRRYLNGRISRWTSLRTARSVEKTLQEAGIAAYAVQAGGDLMSDPQLEARRFFVPLVHPVLGMMKADRSAAWPCREDCSGWRPAPSLGEANPDLFLGVLGMSETRFREYVRRGVIG